MRYCIGCKHLSYDPVKMGHSAETGSWVSEDPAMCCAKGHWRHMFSNNYEEEAVDSHFELAMQHAENCKDYKERDVVEPETKNPLTAFNNAADAAYEEKRNAEDNQE